MGVQLLGVHLNDIHPVNVHLIGVYLISVHLIIISAHSPHIDSRPRYIPIPPPLPRLPAINQTDWTKSN